MSSARVALVSRIFLPEPGAAAYRLGALVRHLGARGVRVTVLTSTVPAGLTDIPAVAGVRVRRWPVLRDAGGTVRGYLPFASFDVPLLGRLLTMARPDVVVVEPPPTTGAVVRIVCALRRVPYVYYAGDVSSTAAASIGVPAPVVAALRALERFAVRGARVVLTVSHGVADDLRALAGAVPTQVVGTGVDTDVFRLLPHEERTPTFVYAGTMSELHGAEVFVRAFARVAKEHPSARLIMYGQGVDVPRLAELADQLVPGRVLFPGRVPATVVAEALSNAAAGLASLRPHGSYEYAYPTKMFAVTACGTPVIYAGPGPGHDMVRDHELGWACPWTPEAVASAMNAALARPHDPTDRARLNAWTVANASQRCVGERAALAVLDVGAGALPRQTPWAREEADTP